MPVQTHYTRATPGEWIQVAEYRPGRKSLRFEFLSGDAIFSNTTNLPMVTGIFGRSPAGVYYSIRGFDAGLFFHLTSLHDGELVEQAWYVWIIPGSVELLPPTTLIFTADGSVTFPNGDPLATLTCLGMGGANFDADPVNGPSPGGGGGTFWRNTPFVIEPGDTLTVQCPSSHGPNPGAGGGRAPDTWISRTGVAPLTILDGCLATSGVDCFPPPSLVGGAGGLSILGIGTTGYDGAKGGDVDPFVPGIGGSGGGGGGGGDSGGAPTPGGNGTAGANPGGAGGFDGGGLGGASDGIGTVDGGTSAFGGAGGPAVTPGGTAGLAVAIGPTFATIVYRPPVECIVTAFESFDLQAPPAIQKESKFQVPLPRLSAEGIKHLRNLQRKITNAGKEKPDVLQDHSEPD